jgi:hypothetical protein
MKGGWFHLLKENSVTLILAGGRGMAMPLQNVAIFDIFFDCMKPP